MGKDSHKTNSAALYLVDCYRLVCAILHLHIFSFSLSQSLLFRVRQMHPCIISNVSFEVDLPEDDEIQVR